MSEYPSDWTIGNLGDHLEETKERAGSGDITPYSVSKVLGIVPQSEKFNKRVASSDISNYKVIRKGDFAYDPMLLWDGSINRMLRGGTGAVSPAYVTFRLVSDSLDADYLLHLLKASTTKTFYKSISKGTNVRRQKAEFGDFAAGEFAFPPLPEQKKIAEILSGIDKRITASDNLQKYYLLLLDSVSRDSFKIEAGEIKTLGELAEFKSGRAFKSEELSEDGIKITRISNLHKPNFPYWRYSGEYNPKIVAKDGDILFSWAGVANTINVHRYRGEDSLLNQHIYNFEFDDPLIKEWSYWNLRNMLPKLRESIEGGAGQLHLTKGFIQSLPIPILSRSKMDSLSKCFQSIQTLVEAQKKTSIKLLALKNAFLSDLLSGRKRVSV